MLFVGPPVLRFFDLEIVVLVHIACLPKGSSLCTKECFLSVLFPITCILRGVGCTLRIGWDSHRRFDESHSQSFRIAWMLRTDLALYPHRDGKSMRSNQ